MQDNPPPRPYAPSHHPYSGPEHFLNSAQSILQIESSSSSSYLGSSAIQEESAHNLLTSLKRTWNDSVTKVTTEMAALSNAPTAPGPSSSLYVGAAPSSSASLSSLHSALPPSQPSQPLFRQLNSVPRFTATNRTMHVGLCSSDLASRVLTVGDPARAALLAAHLAPRPRDGGRLFINASARGFTTYTGLLCGNEISIVTFGMGSQMIDFLVRECRDVAPKGPMVIVSYGSCGGISQAARAGVVNVATGAVLVTRNTDQWTRDQEERKRRSESRKKRSRTAEAAALAGRQKAMSVDVVSGATEGESLGDSFSSASSIYSSWPPNRMPASSPPPAPAAKAAVPPPPAPPAPPAASPVPSSSPRFGAPSAGGKRSGSSSSAAEYYNVSQPIPSNPALASHLHRHLVAALGSVGVVSGLTCTADSFYSSQGRVDANFDDKNTALMRDVVRRHPTAHGMEMEAFHLLDLARLARRPNAIAAATCSVVIGNRIDGDVLDSKTLAAVEGRGGAAILRAVATVDIAEVFAGLDLLGEDSDEEEGSEGSRSSEGSECTDEGRKDETERRGDGMEAGSF